MPWPTRTPSVPWPRVVVLGRLVPQKRVEIALDAVATLRTRVPGLHLDVVGHRLVGAPPARARRRARARGDVTFHGHVSEAEKHQLLARAWVHAMPSLKEGWGLVVVEAGVHGTPTVAFRSAGGPADSIATGRPGCSSARPGRAGGRGFARTLESLLTDDARRERMSRGPALGSRFRWEDCIDGLGAAAGSRGGSLTAVREAGGAGAERPRSPTGADQVDGDQGAS